MLEFAENCDNAKVDMDKVERGRVGDGYVVLPIGEYNELVRRADAAGNAIKLSRRDYVSTRPIEVEIDKQWLYKLARAKLFEQYSAEELSKYNIAPSADDLIVLDVAIAHLHEPIRQKED